MTPRIITYFLCGMRHPTTGLSEDDLSRLTGSSSSTASADSSSSSSSSSSAANTPAHKEEIGLNIESLSQSSIHQNLLKNSHISSSDNLSNNNNNNNNNTTNTTPETNNHQQQQQRFNSTYLPEFINPLDWQKSRKRKDRLDSNSSATQDRKLQRSNSEELLPPDSNSAIKQNNSNDLNATNKSICSVSTVTEVIRRVSSEDFKRTPYAVYEQELKKEAALEKEQQQQQQQQQQPALLKSASIENDASVANKRRHQQETAPWFSGVTRDMTRRTRCETSPARSQRHSPQRNNGGGKHRDSDDSECEHERRRSSERFSKTRAPPGRKAAGVSKKTVGGSGVAGKYLPTKRSDENVYKYDLSALKYERRGFISKKNAANDKASVNNTAATFTPSDLNDNNLIDFHQQNQQNQESSPEDLSSPTTNHHDTSHHTLSYPISAQEALPWERSMCCEEQAPVLSRRYAAAVRHHRPADIDTAAKLSKVMPYPQQFHKPNSSAAQLLADDDLDGLQPLSVFHAFSSLDNMHTREVMQQVIPAMMSFQSPEERLKQVNKRLTAMKKKLAQLEENYEGRMGYRPSQADRLNDKYMKNVMAELSKLRKERHELKADPMAALGLKVSGGMDASMKLEKMKVALEEIEQNLTDKREDSNRSENLEELTPDQLVQEKTAVQHALLYFESLYGRPTSKEERDAARSLYDRYRQLKRMVSRSVLLSGAAASELPTILEHEAMVFESTPLQYSSPNSTETTNSPSAESNSAALTSAGSSSTTQTNQGSSEDESTATNTVEQSETSTTGGGGSGSAVTASTNENISALNIDQLWELLERTREEKKLLKRSIREYETIFEEQTGRKMLKNDRKSIDETYAQYKEKKAKTRLLQALIKKHISR